MIYTAYKEAPTRPAGEPVVDLPAVAAGYYHSCAVSEDGFASCWGDGTYGRWVQPRNLAFPRKHVATWTKVVPGNAENLQ